MDKEAKSCAICMAIQNTLEGLPLPEALDILCISIYSILEVVEEQSKANHIVEQFIKNLLIIRNDSKDVEES